MATRAGPRVHDAPARRERLAAARVMGSPERLTGNPASPRTGYEPIGGAGAPAVAAGVANLGAPAATSSMLAAVGRWLVLIALELQSRPTCVQARRSERELTADGANGICMATTNPQRDRIGLRDPPQPRMAGRCMPQRIGTKQTWSASSPPRCQRCHEGTPETGGYSQLGAARRCVRHRLRSSSP
jgi:hypothetical protein